MAVRIEEPLFFVIGLSASHCVGLGFSVAHVCIDISGLAILAMSLFDHKSNSHSFNTNGNEI